jgi:hypothetical protein
MRYNARYSAARKLATRNFEHDLPQKMLLSQTLPQKMLVPQTLPMPQVLKQADFSQWPVRLQEQVRYSEARVGWDIA